MSISSNNVIIRPRSNVIPINQKESNKEIVRPGVYDITNEEYHASGGISKSGLKLFDKSPSHYAHRYIYGHDEKKTAAKQFGDALHTYTLQPELFTSDYYVMDKVDRRTTEGKKKYEIMCKEAGSRILVAGDDFQKIEGMYRSIKEHATAPLLLQNVQVEKSIYWNDPFTNILLKCRPDIWHENYIGELKTAADASEFSFSRDIGQYWYHVQAAMILDGIYAVTGKKIDTYAFIVIEKEDPFVVAVYELESPSIEIGRQKYKQVLVDYRDHLERQDWSGYKTKSISLPAYYFN